jgi:RNA polymerase sigma factor (sigma-70 family)
MTVQEYNKSVDAFADGVYRFILKNLKNTEKAKDIVQDTFEKLWMNVSSVNFQKSKSYIYTTAYHTMIDSIRRDKKMVSFDYTELTSFSTQKSYSDVGEVLDKAIDRLPADQKSVLLLRDYEGYSYDEIAGITGLSESQVKVYIYRARVYLKEYIGNMSVLV